MVLLNIFSLTDHDINMCWQWLSSTKCYFFKWTYLLFAYSNCFLLCFYWLAATITIHLRYRKSLKSLWFRISGVAKIRFFYVLASINTSILIDSTLKKWLNYLQHSLSHADKSLGRFGLHHDSFSLCGGYFAFERVFVFFSGPRKRKPQKRKPGHSHFLISYSINSYIPHLYTFNTSYPLYNKLFLLRFIILYIYFYFKFSSSLKLRHYNIYFIP